MDWLGLTIFWCVCLCCYFLLWVVCIIDLTGCLVTFVCAELRVFVGLELTYLLLTCIYCLLFFGCFAFVLLVYALFAYCRCFPGIYVCFEVTWAWLQFGFLGSVFTYLLVLIWFFVPTFWVIVLWLGVLVWYLLLLLAVIWFVGVALAALFVFA